MAEKDTELSKHSFKSVDDQGLQGASSTHTNFLAERTDDNSKFSDVLRSAYEQKNFKLLDEIIEDMVSKSLVNGLKKLHTACGYGFYELVEKYLNEKENAIEPNCECSFNDLNGITPLHFCAGIGPDQISSNRDICIEHLLKHGANINHVTSRLDTALHWATKLSEYKVCEKLVKSGIDLNLVNADNCTPAHGAAFYKRIDVLEMLIDNNIDVNVKDISGKNILHLLCKDQIEDINLIPSNSDTNLNETDQNTQNIRDLRRNSFMKLVTRLLVEFKMDPNEKDISEFTPLMYACEHDNLELVKLLVEHNGDINVTNTENVNCMLLAVVNSCPSIVKFLIEKNFDVKNNAGPNVSYITDASYLNDIEILTMLVEAGCDVNETKEDENGVILNPLWAACERTNIIIVEYLLQNGANPIIRPDLKMTALHCCAMAQYESFTIAKLLIEHKCPINLRSAQAGETPLFLACNSGYCEIVEYLLEQGVDINDCSPPSRTCFQQAIFRGHKEIIYLLINKGYILSEEDKNDLSLFIMDLYQDNDVEMLNFLLNKKLTDKTKLLECIARVHEWQGDLNQQQSNHKSSASSNHQTEETGSSAAIASLSNLNLELLNQTYPTNLNELDAYLKSTCVLNHSRTSDENEDGAEHELDLN